MPPLFRPPSCAMHRPSTMIGELAGKNIGKAPLKSSLRQIGSPVAASEQERGPPTPSVYALPPATAGEQRGPECMGAGPPETVMVGYFCCQTTFPLAASRHVTTSSSPCRAKANSLSPTSAGVESPMPSSTVHFFV